MCETKEVCQWFHIFWIFFWISTAPVKLLSTMVNVGLHISVGLGIELSHSTNNWFGVIMWYTLREPMVFNALQCTFGTSFTKKTPYSLQIAKSPFFRNNSCNSQCEDSLSCQDAPMCQILGHLGKLCLGYGHDPSHLPYVQWTFYPVVHTCEEMSKSVAATQIS